MCQNIFFCPFFGFSFLYFIFHMKHNLIGGRQLNLAQKDFNWTLLFLAREYTVMFGPPKLGLAKTQTIFYLFTHNINKFSVLHALQIPFSFFHNTLPLLKKIVHLNQHCTKELYCLHCNTTIQCQFPYSICCLCFGQPKFRWAKHDSILPVGEQIKKVQFNSFYAKFS